MRREGLACIASCVLSLGHMAPVKRDYMLRVLLSDDEQRMLEELADADGLTASDAVRQLIRRSHAERFGSKEPPKPKRKR